MFDGSYPPGVEGWMLDDYEREEPPENCVDCAYYEERNCGFICSILEAEYTSEELEAMSEEEYAEKFGKDPYDHCNDFERWED